MRGLLAALVSQSRGLGGLTGTPLGVGTLRGKREGRGFNGWFERTTRHGWSDMTTRNPFVIRHSSIPRGMAQALAPTMSREELDARRAFLSSPLGDRRLNLETFTLADLLVLENVPNYGWLEGDSDTSSNLAFYNLLVTCQSSFFAGTPTFEILGVVIANTRDTDDNGKERIKILEKAVPLDPRDVLWRIRTWPDGPVTLSFYTRFLPDSHFASFMKNGVKSVIEPEELPMLGPVVERAKRFIAENPSVAVHPSLAALLQ